jgi:hypothetical protein
MKLLPVVSLVLCLLAFGCSKTNTTLTGGGNDFPNPHTSASALGKIIGDNLSKGDHWSDSVALPAACSPLALAQSVSVPVIPSSDLAKKNVSQTLHIDLSDTVHGIVAVYYSVTSDSAIKSDTLIILYDDAFRDNIKNNEHLYLIKGSSLNQLTHVRSSYLFIDSDGDSIINNRNGKPNRVLVSSSTIGPLGALARFEIEIDGGADNNLDTKADMRILQCRTLSLSKNGDTVSLADYHSLSADSALFDATRRDSLLVDVRLIDTDLLLRKTHAEAIFAIFPSDSSKNRAVYFRSEKSFSNGAVVKRLVRGIRSDSLFSMGDTALAYYIIESGNDTVSLDTLRLRMLIGRNPSDSAGNFLVDLYSHKTTRMTDDRETIFSLTCDQPITKGEKPQSGSFSLKIIYSDGEWITVKGLFTTTGISADYEDSKGNSLKLEWDKNGKPVDG